MIRQWHYQDATNIRWYYWLLPVLITMCVFGGLIVLTEGSVVAPLIYTLF